MHATASQGQSGFHCRASSGSTARVFLPDENLGPKRGQLGLDEFRLEEVMNKCGVSLRLKSISASDHFINISYFINDSSSER